MVSPVSNPIYTYKPQFSYHISLRSASNSDSFEEGDGQYALNYSSRLTYGIQVVLRDCAIGLDDSGPGQILYQLSPECFEIENGIGVLYKE
jgi:hypothetical protein